MPKKTLRQLVENAVAAGLDPATPALAIAHATRPNETMVAAPIGELAKATLPDGPTIVMIGSVCAVRIRSSPFIPAKAGIQQKQVWVPAFAGTNGSGG